MGLTRDLTGAPLTAPPVYFAEGAPAQRVAAGPRVNVVGAEAYPWRFWDAGSAAVSKAAPAKKRSR